MNEQRSGAALARTWECAELVCAIAGAMDASSLLAFRATSSVFRDLLSNDERLFEGAFRRTFPRHRNTRVTRVREDAMVPLSYGSRWRALCVRRLAVRATHKAAGVGFSDLARSWPLPHSAAQLDGGHIIDMPLLAETLRHHVESIANTSTAQLPSPALHALLRWCVQRELYDLVLACSAICVSRLERMRRFESLEKGNRYTREQNLLRHSAFLALKQTCRDGRAEQLRRLLCAWRSVEGFGATPKRSLSWLRGLVRHQLIGRESVPTDPAVLEQLVSSDLLRDEEPHRTAITVANVLVAACGAGRADTVRWLQLSFSHVFDVVPHVRKAVLAALSSGREEVVRLLWRDYVSHWSPSKRAMHLAEYIDRVHTRVLTLFLGMLCDVSVDRFVRFSEPFRRYICRSRDSDADAVRRAVRLAGYRCSVTDWNAALDFVALRGQVSLLDVLTHLSDEACVGYHRCAASDATRRRLAAAMNADDRRVKLWALARREVTASACTDLLRILESETSVLQTSDDLDAALVGMCLRLHEKDCPRVEDEDDANETAGKECGTAYDDVSNYADPETEDSEERFVSWTCAARRNELVLHSLLGRSTDDGDLRLARLFFAVVCASPTADVARSWLGHPASDAVFASLREHSASRASDPDQSVRYIYVPRWWADQLAHVASDDVFALLLAEERLIPMIDGRLGGLGGPGGHVECALLRCLLTERQTSDSDEERVVLRVRMLLSRSNGKISCQRCCNLMNPIETALLELVLRGRAKLLRALLDDGRFDPSARNNAALRLAVWLQRPGDPPSAIREMLHYDPRVLERARMLRSVPRKSHPVCEQLVNRS
ncbi:Hypothetical protein UVM_LOCUS26 [uncultured virus]|nr:Hypothetical protein UVM_LOCUS26 [uncultured virus]